jgi:hypothetical protein
MFGAAHVAFSRLRELFSRRGRTKLEKEELGQVSSRSSIYSANSESRRCHVMILKFKLLSNRTVIALM